MKDIKIINREKDSFTIEADFDIVADGEKPFTKRIKVEIPIEHLPAIEKLEKEQSNF